jgi:hypothetical protein
MVVESSPESPTLDQHGLIAQDWSCPVCRYNLRAQSPNGACPECGTLIWRSGPAKRQDILQVHVAVCVRVALFVSGSLGNAVVFRVLVPLMSLVYVYSLKSRISMLPTSSFVQLDPSLVRNVIDARLAGPPARQYVLMIV